MQSGKRRRETSLNRRVHLLSAYADEEEPASFFFTRSQPSVSIVIISSLYWSSEKTVPVAVAVENKVDCPWISWSEDKYLMNSTVAMSDCHTHMQSA